MKNTALLYFSLWCFLSVLTEIIIVSSTTASAIIPFTNNYMPLTTLITSISGSLCGFFILLLTAAITNGGIGGGDIKLAFLLGFIYKTQGILFILMAAALLVLCFNIVTIFVFKKQNQRIPFVPFMLLGAIINFAVFNTQ